MSWFYKKPNRIANMQATTQNTLETTKKCSSNHHNCIAKC